MLKNKVIIITGGIGKVGQAFVRSVIENNGIAIIADINSGGLAKFSEILKKEKYTKFEIITLDICSKISISNLIEKLHSKYSKIDALVNNAYPKNKNYGRKMWDVEYSDFCENLSIHVGGYFLMSQLLSEYFVKQGHGNIINISSIYGVIAPRFEIYDNTEMTTPVEYAAIKSSIIHLTKYFAKFLKGKNIRVNCISPGGIFNNQPQEFINKYNSFSLSKGMLIETDLNGTLSFLLSDNSKYINGQNIIVDDGWTL